MHNISHAKKGLNMSDATISKLFHPGTNPTRIFKNIKKLLFFNSSSGTNDTCRFENIKNFFTIQLKALGLLNKTLKKTKTKNDSNA